MPLSRECQITGTYGTDVYEKAITLYPNPSAEEITLEFKAGVSHKSIIRFYSVLGENLAEYFIETGIEHFTIEDMKMPEGLYFYSIFSENTMIAYGKQIIAR